MQSLKHIHETRLSEDGLYEVIEVECHDSMEHEAVWLKEELASGRERGVRLLAEFDNYDVARVRNMLLQDKTGNAKCFSRFST